MTYITEWSDIEQGSCRSFNKILEYVFSTLYIVGILEEISPKIVWYF
jgi:hypothetical protein